MAIKRGLSSSGGAGAESVDAGTRLDSVEADLATISTTINASATYKGETTITSVPASAYTQQIDVAHSAASDNFLLGIEVSGSLNGEIDAQVMDSNGFTAYGFGNGATISDFATNSTVAAGYLGIKARNLSASAQDITVKYWAEQEAITATSVAYSAPAPVLPISGVWDIDSATYSVAESAGTLTIPVNRSEGSLGIGTVDYTTADVTATGGTDYTAASGTLTFNEGVLVQNIVITILEDANAEASETFTVTISNPGTGTSLGAVTATTVTITDNDPVHELILDDMTGFAAAAGTTGGKGGVLVEVANLNDSGAGSLRQAIIDASGPTWIHFNSALSGTITLLSNIALGPLGVNDLTIDGRGADVTIAGYGFLLENDHMTVAIENYVFTHLKLNTSDTQGIRLVNNVRKVWINKCTATGTKAGSGPIELQTIAGDSYPPPRDVTISYYRIDNLYQGMLVGAEAAQSVDTDITLTLSHIYWNDCETRTPRARWGKVHSYNCFTFDWVNYTPGSISQNGQMQSTNDIFEMDNEAIQTPGVKGGTIGSDTASGSLRVTDPYLLNGATYTEVDAVSVFDYTDYYTLPDLTTADATLKTLVIADAGYQSDAFPT